MAASDLAFPWPTPRAGTIGRPESLRAPSVTPSVARSLGRSTPTPRTRNWRPGPGFRLKADMTARELLTVGAYYQVADLGAESFLTCSGFHFDYEAMAQPAGSSLILGTPKISCQPPPSRNFGRPPGNSARVICHSERSEESQTLVLDAGMRNWTRTWIPAQGRNDASCGEIHELLQSFPFSRQSRSDLTLNHVGPAAGILSLTGIFEGIKWTDRMGVIVLARPKPRPTTRVAMLILDYVSQTPPRRL